MKTILPCPKCNQFYLPPDDLSEGARLQCPGCGYQVEADKLFVDIQPTASRWLSAVENAIPDDVTSNALVTAPVDHSMAGNLDGVVAEDMFSAIDEDHGFSTPVRYEEVTYSSASHLEELLGANNAEVPPSNEWETQPSSLEGQESREEANADDDGCILDDDRLFDEQDLKDEFVVDDESVVEHGSTVQEAEQNAEPESLFEPHDEIEFEDELAFEDPEELRIEGDSPLTLEPIRPSIQPSRDPFSALGKPSRKRPQESPVKMLVSVIGGGVAAIPIAILLMWYVLKNDPLKAGPVVAQYVPWIVPSQFAGPSMGRIKSYAASSQGVNANTSFPQVKMATPESSAGSTLAKNDVRVPESGMKQANIAVKAESLSPTENVIEEMPNVSKEETADREVSRIENKSTVEQSMAIKPAQSIAALKSAIESDPESDNYAILIYDSFLKVGDDLFVLQTDHSPSFKVWQQAALKTAMQATKNVELLQKLARIASTNMPTSQPDGSDVRSRLNLLQVGEIVATEDGEQWVPTSANQTRWKSMRLIAPKSVGLTGKVNGRFLVVGKSQPLDEAVSDIQEDFIILLAIPL